MKIKLMRALLVVSAVALVAALALPALSVRAQSGLLTNIPVVGDLAGGGTFEGVLSITNFAVQNGQLVVSGVLTGTATVGGVVTEITQTFTNVAADLLGSAGQCQILNLDLGPIFLDLLGLQVDLSAINLDIVAQSGPGNLLGNLLCAVAGLLDGNGPLAGLNNLLRQINNLL